MKQVQLFLLAILTLAGSVAHGEKPKIATIDASKVRAEYEPAKEDFQNYLAAKAKLEENPRKKELEKIEGPLKEQAKYYNSLPDDDANRSRLLKELTESKENYDDLLNLWQKFKIDQLREITEDFASKSEKRNAEIAAAAGPLAASLGYDFLIETSGTTNSKMPVVLYVRQSTDLTGKLIKVLKDTAPSREDASKAKPSAEKPTGEIPTGSRPE